MAPSSKAFATYCSDDCQARSSPGDARRPSLLSKFAVNFSTIAQLRVSSMNSALLLL